MTAPVSTPRSVSLSPLQSRQLAETEVKLIWRYVAAIDEDEPMVERLEEGKFAVELLDYTEALEKLTYQLDREVV